MAQKNDQVFPVSLSEIALTLVFVLMLLLGYMILQEREAKERAESELTAVNQIQNADAVARAMQQAQQKLGQVLKEAGVSNPAEVVQAVVSAGEAVAERDRARQQVIDLTKRLVALEDVRAKAEQAGKDHDDQVTRDQVERALELQHEVARLILQGAAHGDRSDPKEALSPSDRRQALERVTQAIAAVNELRAQAKEKLGIDVRPGLETKVVREVVEGARIAAVMASDNNGAAAMKAEAEKLRTEVAFYEKRDKLRGLDHPPCWMDKESKIEYIFNVQTTSTGFVVTRGWAPHRESDARASQGFDQLMTNSGTPMSAEKFGQGAKPYLDYGKKQAPECRHFVYLSSTIAEADRRDDARRLVNSFFYVLERKLPVTQ